MAAVQKQLINIQENWTCCADCNETDIEWAEITRGCLLCKQCAGEHRHLGAHVSKIKSILLDVWQKEWVENMKESNIVFNETFEYHVPTEYIKPNEYSTDAVREKYILAKYVGLDPKGNELSPLFHKNGPNGNEGPLPPVYDRANGDLETELIATESNTPCYFQTFAIMLRQLCA